MKIAYLGPKGTFSHGAALMFCRIREVTPDLVPSDTIEDVITAVRTDLSITYAIIPFENEIIGKINNPDLTKDLKIVEKIDLPVPMSIGGLADTLENIDIIYSKDKALQQCTDYLEQFFGILRNGMAHQDYIEYLQREGKVVFTNSTAAAMELIKKEKMINAAAIGYKVGLEINRLKIYDENIGNVKGARTKFVVLEKKLPLS